MGSSIALSDALPGEPSGGQALRIAGAAGTTVALEIPAPADGDWTLEPILVEGAKASAFTIRKDGAAVGFRTRLAKGPNRIEIELTGSPVDGDRCEVLLDAIRLHPWKNFIRRWYIAGPFDNANAEGFERAYGPESTPFAADQQFDGLGGGKVLWRVVESPSGLFGPDLKLFKVNDDIVFYAYCELVSPGIRSAGALAASDDGIKAWVNGALVHKNFQRRVVTPDEDRFQVELKEGRNPVLLKIDQGGGPWGFCFRIDDPEEKLTSAP